MLVVLTLGLFVLSVTALVLAACVVAAEADDAAADLFADDDEVSRV